MVNIGSEWAICLHFIAAVLFIMRTKTLLQGRTMIKLLITLLFGLTSVNIPAMHADASLPLIGTTVTMPTGPDSESCLTQIDEATILANAQLQAAMAADDIDAAKEAFNNKAKFSFWNAKEGTRSQRQVNALNFIIKHFKAGGESKQTASEILGKLDVKTWTTLCGMEDGFEQQAPIEMLSSEELIEISFLIKKLHFNSDRDELLYQEYLGLTAPQEAKDAQENA